MVRKSFDEYKKIKSQLGDLKKRKSDLDKKLDEIKSSLAVNQDDEFEVMEDLTKKANELMKSVNVLTGMIKNGVQLNKKRIETEKEISEILTMTEKLERIHKDLAEVWE